MSFLDAYSSYHQFPFFGPDQECTTFITTMGLYYYKVMLFELKNDRETYKRLVTKMFRDKIEKSMEVYVDNMLVESNKAAHYANDDTKNLKTAKGY